MPRTGRGGARQGKVGTAYANRRDLTQAPTAATGQPYGQAGQQLAAQRVLPLPRTPPPPGSLPVPRAQAARVNHSAPGGPPLAVPPVTPGSLGALHRPSERPHEPVTAGLPVGAGPGPEALQQPGAASSMSALLGSIADASGSPDLAFLAQRARDLGQ